MRTGAPCICKRLYQLLLFPNIPAGGSHASKPPAVSIESQPMQPHTSNVPLVLALWGAGLGAAAQFGKISVMFGTLSAAYGDTGAGIGFMVSLVGLIGLVFGTTAGLLVQRIGYRRVLVGALALGAVISAFQAMLPAYPLMMASRVIEGASHLAIVVAGPTLIAQVTAQRHQGMAMTLWASFFGVSFALTAWLGLPLVAVFGPSALFIAHALYMALFAGILAAMLPKDPRETYLALSILTLIRQHGTIYRSPRVSAPGLGFLFYTLMYVALLTLLPQMAGDDLRPLIATLMPLSSIALSLTLGVWLLRYVSAVALVQIGLGAALVCVLALWLVWGQAVAVVLVSLALAGALGLVQGASFNVIPQLNASAEHRAQAAGALAQMGNLGTTTGTPILAAMIATLGINGVALFALPLCALGILVHAWLKTRRAREFVPAA